MSFFILPFIPFGLNPVVYLFIPIFLLEGSPLHSITPSELKEAEISFLEYNVNGCGDTMDFTPGREVDWKCTALVSPESMDQAVRFSFQFPTDSMRLEVPYANGWGFLFSETEGGYVSAENTIFSEWLATEKIEPFVFLAPNLSIYSPTSWKPIEPGGSKEDVLEEALAFYPYLKPSEVEISALTLFLEWRATVYRNGKVSYITWRFELRHGEC
jgi:hypothetical protein